MKAWLGLVYGVLVVLGVAMLDSAGRSPAAPSTAQDLLFLDDSRPVSLRLHVQVAGRPFREVWEEYLQKLFEELDRDGNGSLSPAEAARVPSGEFLQALFQGELNAETAPIPFATLDTDRDGRVTGPELGAYYRRTGLDALVFQAMSQRADTHGVTAALFHLLDRNRDGKLAAQELAGAAVVLQQVDLDEDELITPEELLRRRPAKTVRGEDRAGPTPANQGFRVVRAGESKATPTSSPDLEVLVRVDHPPSPQGGNALPLPYAEVLGPLPRRLPPPQDVQQTTEKILALPLGNAVLELRLGARGAGNFASLRQFYLQRFQVADADRKGFLTRPQAEESSYLKSLFPLADRDGDGRLSHSELSAFLDLHALGARSFTTLTVVDQSLALFELLDTDREGQLSLRELFSAWAQLRRYDRDGDGAVSLEELPRRYQLTLVRGWSKPVPHAARSEASSKGRGARGPLWFRNMDVNGDGEVSRREFLGSLEAFRRLDADADGLISLEEAERAEAAHLEKKGPRPGPDGH